MVGFEQFVHHKGNGVSNVTLRLVRFPLGWRPRKVPLRSNLSTGSVSLENLVSMWRYVIGSWQADMTCKRWLSSEETKGALPVASLVLKVMMPGADRRCAPGVVIQPMLRRQYLTVCNEAQKGFCTKASIRLVQPTSTCLDFMLEARIGLA